MTMKKARPPRPTQAELAILQVLWARGPSTVREVHEALEGDRPWGYTTVLKLLQIMASKGHVTRDASRRAHRYQALRSADQTRRQLVGDLMERAFGGSAGRLALQALSQRRATPEEMSEIRRILDEMEGGRR